MNLKVEVGPSSSASSLEDAVSDRRDGFEPRAAAQTVSGLYVARPDDDDDDLSLEVSANGDGAGRRAPATLASSAGREELRLDVDGRYPQGVASGVSVFGLQSVRWIASLTGAGPNRWTGSIFYKDGAVATFPYTTVQVRVLDEDASDAAVRVRLEAAGGLRRTRRLRYKSRYFHKVDFEFDAAEGEAPTTEIQTCAHPNRPATLPCERLTIRNVYRRAGFDVS